VSADTLPDQAWAAKLGKPERDKGESRSAYIERVLAAEDQRRIRGKTRPVRAM
jgi:hypothetical protein